MMCCPESLMKLFMSDLSLFEQKEYEWKPLKSLCFILNLWTHESQVTGNWLGITPWLVNATFIHPSK